MRHHCLILLLPRRLQLRNKCLNAHLLVQLKQVGLASELLFSELRVDDLRCDGKLLLLLELLNSVVVKFLCWQSDADFGAVAL